jgi:hypothetical protein
MTPRTEAILGWLRTHEAEPIALLERLVNQDRGTYDRPAVNCVGGMRAEQRWDGAQAGCLARRTPRRFQPAGAGCAPGALHGKMV